MDERISEDLAVAPWIITVIHAFSWEVAVVPAKEITIPVEMEEMVVESY